ncbi:antibiotic biosynthesis monooxygenase [Streptomyces sp. NPDC051940]|uniref:antibiotic biosynthesis monooxygenase family protein n=1 Tax=Streptomyces sp. NPDC051940 TaxID=3155675 RepID=UPI00343EB2CD
MFTSIRPDNPEGYAEALDRMKEIVQEIPGFLGYESARTPGGIGITVAYFRDEASLAVWRQNTEHQAVQRHGREHWYDAYSLHVGKVERSYSFDRR